MLSRSRFQGFTVLQLIVVIALVVIAIAILLPALEPPRKNRRQMPNNTQLRGIHQSFVTFAQSNKRGGNDGYFPGFDATGNVIPDSEETGYSGDGTQPAARLRLLLDNNLVTPDYIINPVDARAVEYVFTEHRHADPDNPLTADHFSYAMLGLVEERVQDEDGHSYSRSIEWRETLNTSAIVMSDRGLGTGRADLSSVWTEPNSGDWRGGVVRNDNSTAFEITAEFKQTRYGVALVNDFDHLFEDAPAASDALMVFEDATTAYSKN